MEKCSYCHKVIEGSDYWLLRSTNPPGYWYFCSTPHLLDFVASRKIPDGEFLLRKPGGNYQTFENISELKEELKTISKELLLGRFG